MQCMQINFYGMVNSYMYTYMYRTGALRARLVRLVQPAKVETVQVSCTLYITNGFM